MTNSRILAPALAVASLVSAGCASPSGPVAGPMTPIATSATAPSSVATSDPAPPAAATTITTTTTAATTTTSARSITTSSAPTTTSTTTTSTTTTVLPPPTTACTDVAHIADSTGVYLWEAQYVDGAANTMGERYRSVGVERWIDDSSGGRSIRERAAEWQTNALEAADAIRSTGFDGCWVIMIGTNDAANIAAGANLGHEERILRLLFVLGDDPVLWVDAATIRSGTAYADDHMRAWNEALYRIAADRENVRVLRWSEQVRPEWFVEDGIHMNTAGRIWRAAVTAEALLEEFPT